MSEREAGKPSEDQEFKIVHIEKVGENEYVITTRSKAYGDVTQRVTIVPGPAAVHDPKETACAG